MIFIKKKTLALPCIKIVVALVYGLGELFDARSVVLLINRNEFLRERVEKLDLMLVLV